MGPNGAGKTTLFRMILAEESPDKGTIRKRPRLRIGYLPQELETITGKTVLDATHRDLYPEHEAERILMGLGFTEIDFSRQIEKLSGGYRMRVALAHLLLTNPDVLLLDEPTNHLDKPTQRWFEQFLLNSEMTLLIISHDTAFLDRVVTHIWDLRHHKIEEYRGNLYLVQKDPRRTGCSACGCRGAAGERSRPGPNICRSIPLPSEQSQPGPIAHQAA